MASSATLTTTNLPKLKAILEEWREAQPPAKPFAELPSDATARTKEGLLKDVIVAFRTRPPLPDEASEKFHGEESEGTAPPVEFCPGITVASAEPGKFVAHVPGMKWTGPTLTHKEYASDLAFGPDVNNEEVYQRTVVANDLLPLVINGGIGCVLAYGQTGTGKTFTMEGLEGRVARDLFKAAQAVEDRLSAKEQSADPDLTSEGMFEFSVMFLELLGKRVADLVEPSDEIDAMGNPIRKEIPIKEDKVGNVQPKAISTVVHSSDELEKLIVESLSYRRTSATLRNAASSRSHALLIIRVKNRSLPYADQGQLILVDLAGSERYEDSKAHDKQRMNESRENNKSLMNLKECVRAKAKMASQDGFVHIPWRSNKLTMLLKPIFDVESRQPSRTIVMAHVSPHIQDTVHSTNTLSYAAPFTSSPPKPHGPAPYDAKDPRTWDTDQTRAWFLQQFTSAAKARRLASWKVRQREAQAKGKNLKPLDQSSVENLDLGIDVEKLCAANSGFTARTFGGMYTTEFVEMCLDARIPESKLPVQKLKDAAVDIAGELTYLIVTAKTKSRNAIMKNRKKLAIDETYGEAPVWIEVIQHAEMMEAREFYGTQWQNKVDTAVAEALKEGADPVSAKAAAMQVMIQGWHKEKARREAKADADEVTNRT